MALVSLNSDIKRLFQYHGAEHKSIYCYENDLELTVENARKFGRLHPRCGTNFLFIVMFTSIILFSFWMAKSITKSNNKDCMHSSSSWHSL